MTRRQAIMVSIFSFVAGLFRPAPVSVADEHTTAYDFSFTSIDGMPMPLAQYSGRVLLIVNTASFCGFTSQYAGLESLYETYRDRGLTIIGVPSNDFAGQEPAAEAEIKQFCETTFGIEFPLTSKVSVSGEKAHPFYRWAGATLGTVAKPRWNFHKYLVAPDGQLVDWFSTITAPSSPAVIEAIEQQLRRINRPAEPTTKPAPAARPKQPVSAEEVH